jgi:hypothetical protein
MKSGFLIYPVALGGKRWGWENVAKKLVAALAVVSLSVVGWVAVDRMSAGSKHNCDFTVYTAAGQAVLDGANIYRACNDRGLYYVYPPPFAVCAVVLALLPAFWVPLLWYGLAVALMTWAVRMCVSLAGDSTARRSNSFWIYAAVALFISPWFIQAAADGQATTLMAWLIVAAWYWQRRGRPVAGGACLAGAILLKVFPVVLLGYFVMRKQWHFLVACLIALVIGAFVVPLAALGEAKTIQYWREWVNIVAEPAVGNGESRQHSPVNKQLLSPHKACNQTLASVYWRLAGDRLAWRLTGDRGARAMAAGIGAAMAVVMILVAWQSRPGSETTIFAAALVWMLLLPPTSEFHYNLVTLLPLTVLIVQAGDERGAPLRTLSRVSLIVFAAVSLFTLGFTALQLLGLLCFANIGLWGVLLLSALRQSPAPVRHQIS